MSIKVKNMLAALEDDFQRVERPGEIAFAVVKDDRYVYAHSGSAGVTASADGWPQTNEQAEAEAERLARGVGGEVVVVFNNDETRGRYVAA